MNCAFRACRPKFAHTLCPFKPKYLHIHYLPINSFTNICKNEESGIFKQDDLRRMGTSRRDSSVSRGRHQLSNGGRQLDIKEEESPCLFFDIAATCDRDVRYFWSRAPLWSVLIIWHFVADMNVFFCKFSDIEKYPICSGSKVELWSVVIETVRPCISITDCVSIFRTTFTVCFKLKRLPGYLLGMRRTDAGQCSNPPPLVGEAKVFQFSWI